MKSNIEDSSSILEHPFQVLLRLTIHCFPLYVKSKGAYGGTLNQLIAAVRLIASAKASPLPATRKGEPQSAGQSHLLREVRDLELPRFLK